MGWTGSALLKQLSPSFLTCTTDCGALSLYLPSSSPPPPTHPLPSLIRQQALQGDALAALKEMLSCLEVECQAVTAVASGKHRGSLGPGSDKNEAKQAADALLEATQAS